MMRRTTARGFRTASTELSRSRACSINMYKWPGDVSSRLLRRRRSVTSSMLKGSTPSPGYNRAPDQVLKVEVEEVDHVEDVGDSPVHHLDLVPKEERGNGGGSGGGGQVAGHGRETAYWILEELHQRV